MSEYQYYEFRAVDRPLSQAEQARVRRWSTRAEITEDAFVNTYDWGDFRGDPTEFAHRWYDAHLYCTNWGTHRLMLRLPAGDLDVEAAQDYCLGAEESGVEVSAVGRWTIWDVTAVYEDDDLYAPDDEETLDGLLGLREEIAGGDMHGPYSAWLMALRAWEQEDDDEDAFAAVLEPPVPAGLGRLTAPQQALVEFLAVDADLLAAAAATSPPSTPGRRRSAAELLDAADRLRIERARAAGTVRPRMMRTS